MIFNNTDLQGYLSAESNSFSTSTDLGALTAKKTITYYTGAGGDTFTLPLASTFGSLMQIIKNMGTGSLTVAAASNDLFYGDLTHVPAAHTSLTLAAGDAVALLGNGTYLLRIGSLICSGAAPV